MRKLILVKHSAPAIIPTVPAREWHLSDEGRTKAVTLAGQLAAYHPGAIITSTEPKAIETGQMVAERLGIPVETVEDLHEHERSQAGFTGNEEFQASVARFFASPEQLVFGSETADAAHRRFAQAVENVLAAHPEGNVVIVAHGTVITLFVTRLSGQDAFPFWKSLGLPSYVELHVGDGDDCTEANACGNNAWGRKSEGSLHHSVLSF